jgi:hypothetical protein
MGKGVPMQYLMRWIATVLQLASLVYTCLVLYPEPFISHGLHPKGLEMTGAVKSMMGIHRGALVIIIYVYSYIFKSVGQCCCLTRGSCAKEQMLTAPVSQL